MSGEWDALARTYDLQLGLERAAVECLIDLLAPRASHRLLDLGTGTGAVLRALAGRAGRPTNVTGIDASAAMLARVPPLPAGWSLIEGDVTRLRVADRSVDLISAAYLLHVLPEAQRRRAIAEMARVLAPAGRVAVVVPALPRGLCERPYRRALRALERHSPTALGLRPIEAVGELARAGLRPARGRYLRRGYPSVCLLAHAAD
ncbi:hypothetical protein BH20ACT19_BH20ACT19_12950 [soil metagenome]